MDVDVQVQRLLRTKTKISFLLTKKNSEFSLNAIFLNCSNVKVTWYYDMKRRLMLTKHFYCYLPSGQMRQYPEIGRL
jgi:hypothetical protein